jgi:hypothetical protein
VTQRQHHHASVLYQAGDIRHGASPLRLVEMHPHRAQHDQIERLVAADDRCQVGQAVVEPLDIWRRMESHSCDPQGGCRLNRDNAVSERRESARVAAGARADIQHPAGRRRVEMVDLAVDVVKANAFILLEQRRGLFGVAFRTAHSLLHALPPPSRSRYSP